MSILTFSILSCTNDSESDLIVAPEVEVITYNNYVKNVINSNCLFCHTSPPQNGAPMQLTTYEDVKNAVLNRGLLDRISRPQGATGMMPLGGTRLPQTTIDAIVKWQADGLLE
ncbi:cytochrome c [Flavobacterium sp. J27]|uniref:c-type cytochrome n=1 Tax=Flavobacterium sp. J27 TaxID=2060419 RepID=UPI0010326761|nr:cytochrome c [Flavobacterium sp. J27]